MKNMEPRTEDNLWDAAAVVTSHVSVGISLYAVMKHGGWIAGVLFVVSLVPAAILIKILTLRNARLEIQEQTIDLQHSIIEGLTEK